MDLLRTVNDESVGDWVRFPNHDAALTNIFLLFPNQYYYVRAGMLPHPLCKEGRHIKLKGCVK